MSTRYHNGRHQLIVQDLAKNKNKIYQQATEQQLERGRIRKAIEDRKIQKELLEADPW